MFNSFSTSSPRSLPEWRVARVDELVFQGPKAVLIVSNAQFVRSAGFAFFNRDLNICLRSLVRRKRTLAVARGSTKVEGREGSMSYLGQAHVHKYWAAVR